MSGLKNVRQRHDDALSRVGWDHFESLLAVYYRGQGYEVEHCGTGGAGGRFDGGIDLKLRRPGEYVLVQCKHWNAKQVPHNDVHQLLGLMLNENATGGILVTSGEFTTAATQAAARLGRVHLVEGRELRSMWGPLPERPADRMGVLQSVSGALGTVVTGELRNQVMSAAGDGLRHHARRMAGRAAQGALVTLGMKLLVAGLFLAIAVYLLNSIGAVLQSQFAQPVNRSPTTPMPTPSSASFQTSPARVQASAAERCRELIDATSGTYIDHCMGSTPPPALTEEERRALTRKADEAMKVIEASTPEM